MKTTEDSKLPGSSPVRSHDWLGDKERKYLDTFYELMGTTTVTARTELLMRRLGGTFNFYTENGAPTEQQKLACLESEYLERMGVVSPNVELTRGADSTQSKG